ncbi:MAG TPA: hypothetical protein VFH51_09195 [Myxococcota bacterium]|nr:hypothetical protein [Myxococcota bacterium]
MHETPVPCLICGRGHAPSSSHVAGDCPEVQAVVASGARPRHVPSRVYTGYLSAREALRANAPQAATEALHAVLSCIAEERGVRSDESFSNKMAKLCDDGIIGARLRTTVKRALEGDPSLDRAWALMSIAEHAFYHLYLQKARTP